MSSRLFIVVMFRDFDREKIAYAGLYPSKQEILKNIPLLSYNDLIYKEKKYKTPKALFTCIEIPTNKKYIFNTYHLTQDRRERRKLIRRPF